MVYDVSFFTGITIEAKSDIRDPKDLYLLSRPKAFPLIISSAVTKTLLTSRNMLASLS